MTTILLHGNCLEVLPSLPDCSIDSVVTDPPYELGFMGKKWDNSGIAYSVEMWREVLRVLKPGGHLLAFGGTRTYHRMAVAIEDAGFEIRDSIHWIYGSGFPKSLDVSKAIDKAAGAKRGACDDYAPDTLAPAPEDRDICTTCFYRGVDHTAAGTGDHVGNIDFGMKNRCSKCDLPYFSANPCKCPKPLAVTDDAKDWSGWGTALKPAHEPIIVARKPLIGTVAANVLQHGTGALNIDGTRIGGEHGRWPANVIFDPDAAAELDRHSEGVSRFFYVPKPSKAERNAGLDGLPKRNKYQAGGVGGTGGIRDVAQAVNATPVANHHPTVKPLALMRYLVRLVTPPGGIVLDPFAGSGTTLMAAVLEGFNSIGIEMTDDYLPIIRGRVAWAENQPKSDPEPIQEELPL